MDRQRTSINSVSSFKESNYLVTTSFFPFSILSINKDGVYFLQQLFYWEVVPKSLNSSACLTRIEIWTLKNTKIEGKNKEGNSLQSKTASPPFPRSHFLFCNGIFNMGILFHWGFFSSLSSSIFYLLGVPSYFFLYFPHPLLVITLYLYHCQGRCKRSGFFLPLFASPVSIIIVPTLHFRPPPKLSLSLSIKFLHTSHYRIPFIFRKQKKKTIISVLSSSFIVILHQSSSLLFEFSTNLSFLISPICTLYRLLSLSLAAFWYRLCTRLFRVSFLSIGFISNLSLFWWVDDMHITRR